MPDWRAVRGCGRWGADSDAGFALAAVLLTGAFLVVVVLRLTTAARTETHIAVNLQHAAVLRSAADGGVFRAAFVILDQPERSLRQLRFAETRDGVVVDVALRDEGDLIDLNSAPAEMLRAAFMIAGLGSTRAEALAESVVLWRTPVAGERPALPGLPYAAPGEKFRDVDELELVPGFDQALLARLMPHLTVYTDALPGQDTADPLVAATLRALRKQNGFEPPPRLPGRPIIVRIIATARGRDGAACTRTSVLKLDPTAKAAACQVLAWH